MPTVLDVARLAGVSSATVSRVLSGDAKVSEHTRERVLVAIKEIDYRPNEMAKSLRKGRGNSVALLVGDIEQSIYSALTKQVQMALEEVGLDLVLYNLSHRDDRLSHLLDRAAAMQLRGVAIATTDPIPLKQIQPIVTELQKQKILVVSIGQRLQKYGIPSIAYEEHEATRRSVGYLIKSGRRTIAYVGRITSAIGAERYRGYCLALKDAGISLRKELVWDAAYRHAGGYTAMMRAVERKIKVDAVQAGSDEIAFGVMAALLDRKLRIPEDVAVIGFGNTAWSEFARPSLTTLSVSPEVVAASMQAIFREEEPELPAALIPRELLRRQSA